MRVLLVDDSPEDAELVLREVKRAGYEPQSLRVDEEAALRNALVEPWDVVLCDYAMPRFDGMRAFAVCRELVPQTPFIFVSDRLGEERAVDAVRAGARDYVVKSRLHRLRGALHRELAQVEAQARAASELRVERRRFLSVADAAVIGLLDVDFTRTLEALEEAELDRLSDPAALLRTATVHYANRAARELLALDAERGAPTLADALEFSDPAPACDLLRALRLPDHAFHRRVRIAARGGGAEASVLMALHVPARAEDLANVVLCLFDITEYASLEKQLRYARRFDTLGRLSAGVAHDFNNVLQVIQVSTDVVERKLDDRVEQIERELEAIRTAARSARGLIEQLLAFGRGTDRPGAVVDVGDVVDDMLGMLARIGEAALEVVHERGEGHLSVAAGRTALEQIVLNLVVNAGEAMSGGGTVTVETYRTKVVTFHGRAMPGHYVVIAVHDTGCGMDEATAARVFEPMFTTKGETGGTGLGLDTVASLVDGLHGFVEVESEMGRGSSFRVHLPRYLP